MTSSSATPSMRKKKLWLALGSLLLLVLLVPPLFNLQPLRRPLHAAVERQLGRRVEFGRLAVRLLPRPMIIGQQVVVHELPAFGPEPFLYGEEVRCTVPLRVLWTWRLTFSDIHFVGPTITLVRNPDGQWNLASFFLSPPEAPASAEETPRPVLKATRGRIAFKRGLNKQVYALARAQVLVQPQSEGQWHLELEAVPVRSDLRVTETGLLHLRASVRPATEFSAQPFELEARLEEGSLAQLLALARGREPPLRGTLSFAIAAEGTPREWVAEGTFTLADLHRWDLVAPARTPRWQGEFAVTMFDHWERVEIQSARLVTPDSEIHLSGGIEQPFAQMEWDLQAQADRLSLDELLAQFGGLKEDVPAGSRLRGTATLSLEARGPVEEWSGELMVPTPSQLEGPDLPRPARVSPLSVRLSDGRLELSSTTMEFGTDGALILGGELDLARPALPFQMRWRTAQIRMARLRQAAAAFGWDVFHGGRWQGVASFDVEWEGEGMGSEPMRLRGAMNLEEARFHPPECNEALEIVEARFRWQDDGLEVDPLRFQLGEALVVGTLEKRPGRPWKVQLATSQIDLATLNDLLNPARRGLLERLVQTDIRLPRRWLEFAASGEVRMEELRAGPLRLEEVLARGKWQEGTLELTELRFQAYGGRFQGRLQGNFRPQPPQFRLAGNVRQLDLVQFLPATTELGEIFTGSAGAELALETAGLRAGELRRQLRGQVIGVVRDGSINHVNLLASMSEAAGVSANPRPTSEITRLQSLAGEFRVGAEQIEFDRARMIVDGAVVELSGRVGFDGRLDVGLAGGPLLGTGREPTAVSRVLSRSYRAVGVLRRPRVELNEADKESQP